jgi:Spy/CpxP family protein refolding chaperone
MFIKTAAIATLSLGMSCFAQQRQPGPGRMKSQLSLTDSQLQSMRSLREQQRQSMQASMEELHTKERSLRDQLKAGSTDAAALGRLMIDIEATRKRAEASRQSVREQVLAALTPDQKAQLKTLEEARKLGPAIREAEMMGLLDPPAPGEGIDGMMMGRPGPGGPNGFNRSRRPGGPGPGPGARFDQ